MKSSTKKAKSPQKEEKELRQLDDLYLSIVNDGQAYSLIGTAVEDAINGALETVEATLRNEVLRFSNENYTVGQINLVRGNPDYMDNLVKGLVHYYSGDLLINRITFGKSSRVEELEREVDVLKAKLEEMEKNVNSTTNMSEYKAPRDEAPIIRKVTEVGGVDISLLTPSQIRSKIKDLREIIKDNADLVAEGSKYATEETANAKEAIKVLVAELDSRVA